MVEEMVDEMVGEMGVEMVDIVTEMEGMVGDLAKMIHGREPTKAMGTRKILASCEDIRSGKTAKGLSCGGFLEYSIFLPFTNRGKRFFDAICQQGSITSYLLTSSFRPSLFSPDMIFSHSTCMVTRSPLGDSTFGFVFEYHGIYWPSIQRLVFALVGHAFSLILEVTSAVRLYPV